jgi:hypothetical protein
MIIMLCIKMYYSIEALFPFSSTATKTIKHSQFFLDLFLIKLVLETSILILSEVFPTLIIFASRFTKSPI